MILKYINFSNADKAYKEAMFLSNVFYIDGAIVLFLWSLLPFVQENRNLVAIAW